MTLHRGQLASMMAGMAGGRRADGADGTPDADATTEVGASGEDDDEGGGAGPPLRAQSSGSSSSRECSEIEVWPRVGRGLGLAEMRPGCGRDAAESREHGGGGRRRSYGQGGGQM